MLVIKIIQNFFPVFLKSLGVYLIPGNNVFDNLITFIGTKIGHSVYSVYLLFFWTLFNKKFIEWVFYIDPLWKHIRFFYLVEYYVLHSIIVLEFCFVFDLLITGGQCTEFLVSLSWLEYFNNFFNTNFKKAVEGTYTPSQTIVQNNFSSEESMVTSNPADKAPYSVKGVLLFALSIVIYFF